MVVRDLKKRIFFTYVTENFRDRTRHCVVWCRCQIMSLTFQFCPIQLSILPLQCFPPFPKKSRGLDSD